MHGDLSPRAAPFAPSARATCRSSTDEDQDKVGRRAEHLPADSERKRRRVNPPSSLGRAVHDRVTLRAQGAVRTPKKERPSEPSAIKPNPRANAPPVPYLRASRNHPQREASPPRPQTWPAPRAKKPSQPRRTATHEESSVTRFRVSRPSVSKPRCVANVRGSPAERRQSTVRAAESEVAVLAGASAC